MFKVEVEKYQLPPSVISNNISYVKRKRTLFETASKHFPTFPKQVFTIFFFFLLFHNFLQSDDHKVKNLHKI